MEIEKGTRISAPIPRMVKNEKFEEFCAQKSESKRRLFLFAHLCKCSVIVGNGLRNRSESAVPLALWLIASLFRRFGSATRREIAFINHATLPILFQSVEIAHFLGARIFCSASWPFIN